jgi:pyruvate formate lyase activating enzyme
METDLPVPDLNIAGIEKFSTVDWPDQIVATLFLQGCPWRCEYCHNFEILDPKRKGTVDFGEVIAWLKKRKGLLDGVVFSGGEPLMQPKLAVAIALVKSLGFKIGIHTGGAYPSIFEKVLPNLDWVGFDIKAPSDKYDLITKRPNSYSAVSKSLKLLLDSSVDYQLRTTFDDLLLTETDLETINQELADLGVGPTLVQKIRTLGTSSEFQTHYLEKAKN